MKTIFNLLIALAAFMAQLFTFKAPRAYIRRDLCAGADVYADEYTNAYITSPPVKLSAAQQGGRVRIFRATYTQGVADGAIGDVIKFGKLPAGATRLPYGRAFFSAGDANATLAIGITGAAADMAAATAITNAGNVALDVFAAGGAVSTLAAEKEVIGTNATAAIKGGQKVTVWIPYVMND